MNAVTFELANSVYTLKSLFENKAREDEILRKKHLFLFITLLIGGGVVLFAKNNQDSAFLNIKDPFFYKQWYLDNNGFPKGKNELFTSDIGFCKGMDINYTTFAKKYCMQKEQTENFIVAVIDTGINYNHEDLEGHIWKNKKEIEDGCDNDNNGFIDDLYGWNFTNNSNCLLSYQRDEYENDHGTMCAGIIAARHNNKGICGINLSNNIRIMSLKVLNGISKEGEIENVIRAIKYAEKMGAKICNLSINTKKYSPSLYECIKKSKLLFVCSAGNEGINIDKTKRYPASFGLPNIISVGSIDSEGNYYSGSNYGVVSVDLLVPGTNIYSTCVDGYDYDTGTSMSTAIVTGVASVLWQDNIDLSVGDIISLVLENTVQKENLKPYCKSGSLLYTR